MTARITETVARLPALGNSGHGASAPPRLADVHECLGDITDFVKQTRAPVAVELRLRAHSYVIEVRTAQWREGGSEVTASHTHPICADATPRAAPLPFVA